MNTGTALSVFGLMRPFYVRLDEAASGLPLLALGFLKSRGYLHVNRLLGVALVVFAVLFVRDGLRFSGLIFG